MSGLAAAAASPTFRPCWRDGFDDAVSDLACGTKGGLVAAGADGEVRCYADSGEITAQWQAHNGAVMSLRVQPGHSLIATTGEDGTARVWNERGDPVSVVARTPAWVDHLEWTPDGSVLAAAAAHTVYLWCEHGPREVWSDAGRNVLAMAWAPDGKRLATASNKGVYLRRLGSASAAPLLAFPGAPLSLAWSPKGNALAAGTQDGFLHIWRRDAGGKAKQMTMRGYLAKVTCLAWHPRQPRLASAGGKDVVLWSLAADKGANRPHPLRRHEHTITRLAYSFNGTLLASGDRAGRVCLWRESGELEAEWFLDGEVTALQWCGERAALAVGTSDGTLQFYSCTSR